MAGKVLDLDSLVHYDSLAEQIGSSYQEWEGYRSSWLNQKEELRNYLFATDTRTTTNSQLPWKNSTTVPKLTQIRDNLHANYMSALFPTRNWLIWEGDTPEEETSDKKEVIQGYVRTKLSQDRAEVTLSRLLLDFIDYGNCFATVKWVDETDEDENGLPIRGYVGPRIVRIPPTDIIFNPIVSRFEDSPKIIRDVYTIGELKKMADAKPVGSDEHKMFNYALDRSIALRSAATGATRGQRVKSNGLQMDGFGSLENYYRSNYVEVLTFYGDIYDTETDELMTNSVISIIDRRFVISKDKNPNWINSSGIFHAAWRTRPDNLYGMGPLDNLVGMQYRIDHLENLKADVFDLIAHPVIKVVGEVKDFDYEPGARIHVGEDGDVGFLQPDATALNADLQIRELERRMEEMAGAPREAMGIRSPGEKTKYEVQVLDNAASRIFLNKIKHFEIVFLEPLLNFMLQLSRRTLSQNDMARVFDSSLDATIFTTVTPDDLAASGVLRPRGASHFAEKANQLQNLTNLLNSAVGQDEAVKVHLSGKRIAQLVERLIDLDQNEIYSEFVRLMEQTEAQQLLNNAQDASAAEQMEPPGVIPGDTARPNLRPQENVASTAAQLGRVPNAPVQ